VTSNGVPTELRHTLGHKSCPACEWAARLVQREKIMGTLGLCNACDVWLSGKMAKGRLPKTLECCTGQVKHLKQFFGDVPLSDISAGSFKAYQMARLAGIGPFADGEGNPQPVGVSAVNHELNALSQILRRAELWLPIRDFYAPLPDTAWKPPKTFSVTEEARVFDVSGHDPNLELFDIVSRITRNTTASGCELRGLRLKHLELNAAPPRIHIPPDATKNDIRPRVIPLNDEAMDAILRAVERANKLGSHLPYHYLFPFRVNRCTYDPLRAASKSWLRKQTARMREATGIAHVRPHAFRHLAVTELLESGVPEHTVIAIAGWVSRKMIETYSHARIEAKAEAVKVLEKTKKPPKSSNVILFPCAKDFSK
jgi:integrase